MNEITDRAILTALGRQMSNAVQRQSVAAGNLANLDTPDYKARAVAFGDVLDGELDGTASLARTNAGHLGGPPPAGGAESEVDGLPARRDGNTVQLDRELLTMTRASGEFSAAQTALAAKFRLVRYAINEGR
ncbi:MAG TPA: flagellar basal body rod protein FlgB [Vicinamibacterales bacterium]|nr:flagellar basal body rod protein FlgB [Vicinamibacterales bacterium]